MLALVLAARGLERRTTWYLASDQFAFLTFARDLAHGTVFHDSTAFRSLSASETGPAVPVDAYYQTYIWRDGRLFSRYPPGFPALLAVAGALGGEVGQHALNPLLYLVLLAVLALLVVRLMGRDGSVTAAAASLAVVWALLVLPTDVHQWGITIARDLPTHLLALVALLAVHQRRLVLGGLALGFAASIRPDAVLWGVGVGVLALMGRPSRRALLAGTAGFVVGATPLFAYNLVTQGSVLAFSQGSELRDLFVALSRAAHAADTLPARPRFPPARPLVSGGGFRLSSIPYTLPGLLAYVGGAFGALLLPAAGALAWAVARRRQVAAAFGAYVPVGLLFYSCWGRPDPRYIVGVVLCLLALAGIGLVLAARWLAARGGRGRRLVAAGAIAMLAILVPRVVPRPDPDRVGQVERAVGASLVLAAAGLAGPPAVAAAAPLLPALALAAVGVARVATGAGVRDPVQRAQVDRARAAIERDVPPGSLLLTSPGLGRPAENVTWYTGVDASYLGELRPLATTPARTAGFQLQRGRRVFLLLGAVEPAPAGLVLREIARRNGEPLLDWFVDPARAPSGAVLSEVTGVTGR